MTRTAILILALILTFSKAEGQVKQAKREMTLYNYMEAVTLLQKTIKKGDVDMKREATLLMDKSSFLSRICREDLEGQIFTR